MIIIEIIGWIATFFRSAGMLMKSAWRIKILVSLGNLFWLISGLLTYNRPLIASNAICLLIMLIDVVKEKIKKNKDHETNKDSVGTI